MGAQQSIHAGEAKIDVNVDLTHKICSSVILPSLSQGPFSLVIGSLCMKHPNLFGGSEKLDVSWDKGLYDSNFVIAYRRPRPEKLSQQCFLLKHSLIPEIGVHGIPIENFSRSVSGGVNLSRLSAGMELKEPSGRHWSSTTSIKLEHVGMYSDDGRCIRTDSDGFPLTCSGESYDNMVVLKQESRYAKANDRSLTRVNVQIEQGVPLLPKWLLFNRFKLRFTKGMKLGPAFYLSSVTCGSMVGDMGPYQAFAVGGLGSVRGYGDGAVGSGRSFLVANNELTAPLFCRTVEGAVFVDYGTDLGSGRLVPGNPGFRKRKPGSGCGYGYGFRFNLPFGQLKLDYCTNSFRHKTLYFALGNISSS